MAVYFNLTIDCGSSTETAERMRAAFEGLSVPIADAPVVTCRVDRDQVNGQERVYVWPIGWGYSTQVFRRELLEVEATASIQRALLDLLRTFDGYRVARLGQETQDSVEFGEVIEEDNLMWAGCIFAETLLAENSELWQRPAFSPGYRWIPNTEDAIHIRGLT